MLLRPSKELNRIVYGLVARSARLYGVGVCAFVFMSNHCHLLLRPRNVEQLSGFMGYLNGNLAREAGRLHGWREKFWGRRYTPTPVSFEPDAQVARLEYLFAQGCKENLVATPEDWPGATSIHALKSHEPIVGIWCDRTARYRTRHRGSISPGDRFRTVETVELARLPCWDGLSQEEVDLRIREVLERVKEDSRKKAARLGVRPLGRHKILRMNPHERPRVFKRTPGPGFHAATVEVRAMLEAMYRQYRDSYREAMASLCEALSPAPVRFPAHGIPPPALGT